MDSFGPGHETVLGFCEHDNDLRVPLQFGIFSVAEKLLAVNEIF
jgi:hypothetical protein